jgi:tRNA(Ile)-lysidine synthase
LRDEEDFLAELATEAGGRLVAAEALSTSVAAEPPAIARRVVAAWLARHGTVAARHIERVLALAAGRARGSVAVPGPGRVVREGDRLVRRPGRGPVTTPFAAPIAPGDTVVGPGGGWRLLLLAPRPRGEVGVPTASRALFDADRLPASLMVRSPAAGDRVRVAGVGTRKLQDILVDAKVPREARSRVPVLVADGEVLWVAGLARGTGAAIGPATTRIVEGRLEQIG